MVSKAVMAGAVAGLGLVASGCATAPGGNLAASPSHGAFLLAVRDVPAPQGVVDFCQRHPSECAAGAPDAASASALAAGASSKPSAPDAMALFLALLASHASEDPREAVDAPQPRAATLTQERWRLLVDVNGAVNHAIDPISDQELYGVPDYWALPLLAQEWPDARGDCEDYALEKRARLIARGWPAEALSIAVAIGDRGVHATLVAHTDRGDFLLDNIADRPRALERSRYRWLSMQTGADLRTWRSVRIVSGQRGARRAEV